MAPTLMNWAIVDPAIFTNIHVKQHRVQLNDKVDLSQFGPFDDELLIFDAPWSETSIRLENVHFIDPALSFLGHDKNRPWVD